MEFRMRRVRSEMKTVRQINETRIAEIIEYQNENPRIIRTITSLDILAPNAHIQ